MGPTLRCMLCCDDVQYLHTPTHADVCAQTISKPEMLQKVLIAVLSVLVQGAGPAEGEEEEEEDVEEEMDAKSPYSSATKVCYMCGSPSHCY